MFHSDAQEIKSGKWGVESNYQLCSFIKHTAKIKNVPEGFSHSFEIACFRRALGEKPWHKALNFPETGISFNYYHFGENKVFGDAYAIFPFVKFYMLRTKVVDFYARFGCGLGFVTKHYDYITNPNNNIVGSVLNMAASIRFGAEWKLHPNVWLNTAFTFSHFSNGSAKLPNYGINLAIATVGLKIYPQVKTLSYNCTKIKHKKHDEIIVRYSLGIHQAYGLNGPTYFAHIGSIAYARYTGVGNKIYAGVSVEYIPSLADYMYVNDYLNKKDAKRSAIATSLFWGDEIMVGRIGYFVGLGVYVPKAKMLPKPLYFKTGCNYYLAEFGKRKGFKCFVGMNVKAHISVAQYWEVATGMCF